MKQKRIAILGSTGSIGVNTLKVVERHPTKFKVVALTGYSNIRLLSKQIEKFKPKYVAATSEVRVALESQFGSKIKLVDVFHDLAELVSSKDIDVVVLGMRGAAALEPFLSAAKHGKIIAPANKEALVIAGELIMKVAKKHKATIVPVDSEQSAIFQCLQGQQRKDVKKIILTASGGTLRNTPVKKFNKLSVQDILEHPRWKMGQKITVDSATLMNKGFEVIEAQRLFDLDPDQIDVVVHPEAIIHSMVEYVDGSIVAQLSQTDMQIPIQYAMSYPDRLETNIPSIDFAKLGKLTFESPDVKKFPALALAFKVAKKGGTLPAVLNAADEVAVQGFLDGQIKFTAIYDIVEKVVLKHKTKSQPTLDDIYAADEWAREQTQRLLI